MTSAPTPRFLASRCPSCGAAKTRPSPTAYVYCDFCGSLADYDFRKACEQPRSLPGPVYEKLVAKLTAPLKAAFDAGDRAAYTALQVSLFDAWVQACPNAVPPRCADPGFRRAYVARLAASAAFAAFDEKARQLAAATDAAVAALAWTTQGNRAMVVPARFAAMADAVIAQLAYGQSAEVLATLPPSPDNAPPRLQERMALAMFVQGWLPYLDDASADALLQRTGFAQTYVTADAVNATHANCGHCTADLVLLPGAKHAICDGCGRRLEIDAAIDCRGCGHDLRFDDGDNAESCPYCRARIERIAIPGLP